MKKVKTNTLILLSTLICGISVVANANATTYQDRAQVKFTFNPTLTLDLSSTNLSIDELLPGTSRDSNAIDITVDTNNIGGYTLSATVGDVGNASTSLVHTDGSATFSSIGYGSFSSLADGKWGYSIDRGEHYSGLPLYSNEYGATLAYTNGASPSDTTSFLIGAKAAADQPLGTYSNVVNFIAVANVYTIPTLQTVTDVELAAMLPNVGDVVELKDERDCRFYRIGKLADGNIWFLDNMRITNETECANSGEYGSGYYLSEYSDYDYHMDESFGYINSVYIDGGFSIYDPDDKDIVLSEDGVQYNFCAASGASWCADVFHSWENPDGSNSEGCYDDPSTTGTGENGESYSGDPGTCGEGVDPEVNYANELQIYIDSTITDLGDTISTSICPNGWTIPSYSSFSTLANTYDTPNDFVRATRMLPIDNDRYWLNNVSATTDLPAGAVAGSRLYNQDRTKYTYAGPTETTLDRNGFAYVRCKRA